jgi:hypothetical protein
MVLGPGDEARLVFQRELVPCGMLRRQAVAPERALGHDGLREHDQGRALTGMQVGELQAAQQFTIVTEQAAGRAVGIDDAVCVRLDHQHRLGRRFENAF